MIGTRHPPPPPAAIAACVRQALTEDIGAGDLTAALIPEQHRGRAQVTAREAGVLCGQLWFDEVFRQLDAGIRITWRLEDGQPFATDAVLCRLQGSTRALLTGERTALNFLQTLSGTATATRRQVEVIADTGCRLLDTRKTLPGLRDAQKYAVACGGGYNHRRGLYDAILIKENHIRAAGSIAAAVRAAHALHPDAPVEVEVESLEQLDEAIEHGAELVMLDNFPLDRLRQAVERAAGRAALEASGGIDAARLPAIAATGVDFISMGALTKHLRAVDLSMRLL